MSNKTTGEGIPSAPLLLRGDCVELIDRVQDDSVDMLLTDPPYSSGGMFAGDRKSRTGSKYTNKDFNGAHALPDFTGDNMDQLSFMWFMHHTMAQCRPKIKQGGIVAVFTDWRQISATINSLQMAGYVYRGIVTWDKGNSRAIPGRFRNDCEYIVWGTNGARKAEYKKGIAQYPGCYHIKGMNTRQKHHQTEKPVELLKELIKIAPEGGTVMDPFMGSGSTGVACVETGRNFIGMELSENYFAVSKDRIQEALERKRSE